MAQSVIFKKVQILHLQTEIQMVLITYLSLQNFHLTMFLSSNHY